MIEDAPIRDKIASDSPSWVSWWRKIALYAGSVSESGSTANRPVKNLFVGRPYFDTDLGYIIHCKSVSPVVWVDGTGAAV